MATDEDVGSNGLIRYRLRIDPAGHWKSFSLQPVSGILELRLPLDRNKQKIYDVTRLFIHIPNLINVFLCRLESKLMIWECPP